MATTGAKPFSRVDHAQNDLIAVHTVTSFLEQAGWSDDLMGQQEEYKRWDHIYTDPDGKRVPVEVERKQVWKTSGLWNVQWPTLDVPYRKNRSEAELFFMTNLPCDTLAIVKMIHVLSAPVYEKNTAVTRREEFFAVPLDRVQFAYNSKTEGWWMVTYKGRPQRRVDERR